MNLAQDFAKLVRSRQAELGLSDDEVMRRTSLSFNELYDIQRYPDELANAVRLSKVKALFSVLRLDLAQAVGDDSADSGQPPNIRGSREEAGLSVEELADAVGYEPSLIYEIEADPTVLDQYPLELMVDLARAIGTSVKSLVRATS